MAQWIKMSKDFFKKYTSHFIARFACERELETEQNCNILTPTLMAITIVFFLFSWCSTGGPGAHSAGFLYCILSPTGLVPKLHWGSRGPLLLGGSFPYNIFSPTPDFLFSQSYIIVQSPTQSLEWHVWSLSSGNNCHAVHRSPSSGASVYECTMGFFTLSHFVSQACLRNFLSWLPSECVTFFQCITLEWHVNIQHYEQDEIQS